MSMKWTMNLITFCALLKNINGNSSKAIVKIANKSALNFDFKVILKLKINDSEFYKFISSSTGGSDEEIVVRGKLPVLSIEWASRTGTCG